MEHPAKETAQNSQEGYSFSEKGTEGPVGVREDGGRRGMCEFQNFSSVFCQPLLSFTSRTSSSPLLECTVLKGRTASYSFLIGMLYPE